MVHLGEYTVPAQFVPPNFARPGDTAVLVFGEVCVQIRLPDDMIPGRPVLAAHPNVLVQLQQHRDRIFAQTNTESTEEVKYTQRNICERLSRAVTAVIGVGGFVAGSTWYMEKLHRGVFGFSLAFLFFLLVCGLLGMFERRCKKNLGLEQVGAAPEWIDGVMLTLGIAASSVAVGAVFVQALLNRVRKIKSESASQNVLEVWFMAWMVVDVAMTGAFVAYMMSLKRFGVLGMNIRRKFLPWFTIGAQCIAVLFTVIWISCFHLGWRLDKAVSYVGQCILGCVAIVVGCAAPLLSPPPPPESDCAESEENITYLPGALTSLTVFALVSIGMVNTVFDHDGSRPLACGVGVVIVLFVVAGPGFDRRSAMFTQAVCFVSLIGLAIASPSEYAYCHWYLSIAAAIVSRWPAILAAIGLRAHDEVAEEDWAGTTDAQWLLSGATWHTEDSSQTDFLTDSESGKWLIAMVRSRVGIVYAKARRRGADNVRLAGVILVCAVIAACVPEGPHCALTLAIPLAVLCLHIIIQPPGYSPWDAFQVCLLGFALSALPYRIKVSIADDALEDRFFEASLFLCPTLLLLIAHLRSCCADSSGGQQTAEEVGSIFPFARSAALGLALYERIVPWALCPLVCCAFFISWHRSSLTGMAVAVLVLEVRGGVSAWCVAGKISLDRSYMDAECLAFLVGLLSLLLLACAGLVSSSGLASGGLLCLLVPIPTLLAPFTMGWLSWLPGLCAVLYAAARVHWSTVMVAPVVVVFSVGASEYCWLEADRDRHIHSTCWPVPLHSSSAASAAASVSALLLAAWASQRQAGPAVITSWGMALLLAVPGSYWRLFKDAGHCLALIEVGALTISMLVRRPPLLHVWYLLPGTWALSVLLATAGKELVPAMGAAMVVGAVMMVLPWVAHCKPKEDLPRFADQLLGNAPPHKFKRVEPVGMLWLTACSVTGILTELSEGFQICSFTLIGLCCIGQMTLGTFVHRNERWRLLSSMLMASVTVALALGKGVVSTHDSHDGKGHSKFIDSVVAGFVFGGSTLAIISAVLVFFVRLEPSTRASMDEAAARSRLVGTHLEDELLKHKPPQPPS
mmetsp:Transcript_25189/g.57938  ORF Transcript_25189/g.57938 Transcript_25189/m.57938 type:complete len:1080 (+) Transcript_25189:197-3436(+)